MSARPLHVMLMGAAFSQQLLQLQHLQNLRKLSGMFKICTSSAKGYKEVLVKFFVWNLFQA